MDQAREYTIVPTLEVACALKLLQVVASACSASSFSQAIFVPALFTRWVTPITGVQLYRRKTFELGVEMGAGHFSNGEHIHTRFLKAALEALWPIYRLRNT